MHIFVTNKALNGLTLPYLSELLHAYVPIGAPGQLIGCSWTYQGPSSSPDRMEAFLLLVSKSGTTSHNWSDKPLHCPFLKFVLKPSMGLCSFFSVFIVLHCFYVLAFSFNAFFPHLCTALCPVVAVFKALYI